MNRDPDFTKYANSKTAEEAEINYANFCMNRAKLCSNVADPVRMFAWQVTALRNTIKAMKRQGVDLRPEFNQAELFNDLYEILVTEDMRDTHHAIVDLNKENHA